MRHRQSELDRIWKDVTAKTDLTVEELKAIVEVAKARQTEIPWYERSLSTIGILAFFSMMLATSFRLLVRRKLLSIRQMSDRK